MKLIGIVGRAYLNIDNHNIILTSEGARRSLTRNDDVVCITLLPTQDEDYYNIESGKDIVDNRIDYILDKCDGFIIPGGQKYSNFDEYIANYAIKNDKPLLAICLGFQLLCNMNAKNRTNFNMCKTIDSPHHLEEGYDYKHNVFIKENTKLKDIIKNDEIIVNSSHHDIVDFEMDNLVINAISDDNIIEGVEYPNKKFIVGVQWHPEQLRDENSKNLFKAFLNSIGD